MHKLLDFLANGYNMPTCIVNSFHQWLPKL